MLRFYTVFLRWRKGDGKVMDQNVNKTNGFITFSRGHRKDMERPWINMSITPQELHRFLEATDLSNFNMLIKRIEFNWFWCFHWMSHFNMLIKHMEFTWFWCVCLTSDFKMFIKPTEFQWFWITPSVARNIFVTCLMKY